MASQRFFDRLSHSPSSHKPIEEQINADRREAHSQYSKVLREYPFYASLPYLGFYTGVAVTGGLAYTHRAALAESFINTSEFTQTIMAGGIGAAIGLSFIPALPLGLLIYYGIFVPNLAEENIIVTYGSKKNLLDKSTQH